MNTVLDVLCAHPRLRLASIMRTLKESPYTPTEAWYVREYGPVLTLAQAASLLGYQSADALRQARLAERAPIPMFKIPGRRGWHAATAAAARWIEATVDSGSCAGPSHTRQTRQQPGG